MPSLNEFRGTEEDSLKSDEESEDSDDLEEYKEAIANPMDLWTVKKKLHRNDYIEPREFMSDVKLTFKNGIQFNGKESKIGQMASKALKVLRKKSKKTKLDFFLQKFNLH